MISVTTSQSLLSAPPPDSLMPADESLQANIYAAPAVSVQCAEGQNSGHLRYPNATRGIVVLSGRKSIHDWVAREPIKSCQLMQQQCLSLC